MFDSVYLEQDCLMLSDIEIFDASFLRLDENDDELFLNNNNNSICINTNTNSHNNNGYLSSSKFTKRLLRDTEKRFNFCYLKTFECLKGTSFPIKFDRNFLPKKFLFIRNFCKIKFIRAAVEHAVEINS